MKMTELYFLQDTSPGHTQTWDFLKNRMDEAVQLQMMLSQTEGMTHTFQRSFNSAFITVSYPWSLPFVNPLIFLLFYRRVIYSA